MYPYGLIGNCQISALISDQGSIGWLCLPRPDSPPVFGRILDPEGGYFSVSSPAPEKVAMTQRYLPNYTRNGGLHVHSPLLNIILHD
jgi:GH15 family glucan-1,4-alpha-glucosidase